MSSSIEVDKVVMMEVMCVDKDQRRFSRFSQGTKGGHVHAVFSSDNMVLAYQPVGILNIYKRYDFNVRWRLFRAVVACKTEFQNQNRTVKNLKRVVVMPFHRTPRQPLVHTCTWLCETN